MTQIASDTDTDPFAALAVEGLSTESLREQAVNAIRGEIISGGLEPGRVYSARSLAARFGVSATPVREAIIDLVKDGLVTPVRNRGFVTVALSNRDLDDIYDLRVMLEVPGIRALAGKIDEADARRFKLAAEEIELHATDGDLTGFLDADRRFHLGLLELTGNMRLRQMVAQLRDQSRLYGLRDLASTGSLEVSAREHQELLVCLTRGDADAAGELMHRHLRHTRGVWAGLPEPTESAAVAAAVSDPP